MAIGPKSVKSANSDNLSPLVLDLGEKLTPKPTQVGLMGYPDHLNDRFGGTLNKVDIAGQTDGQDNDVTDLTLSDSNRKTVNHKDVTVSVSDDCQHPLLNNFVVDENKYPPPAKAGQFGPKISVLRKKFELSDSVLKSRRCQNRVDSIDKVGTMSAVMCQKKLINSPKSPLVKRMQQNEKKWADNFKKKRELSSLKKQKKLEKEAKLKAEDIERKGITRIQMLYDKIIASKSDKNTSKICPEPKKVTKQEILGGILGLRMPNLTLKRIKQTFNLTTSSKKSQRKMILGMEKVAFTHLDFQPT